MIFLDRLSKVLVEGFGAAKEAPVGKVQDREVLEQAVLNWGTGHRDTIVGLDLTHRLRDGGGDRLDRLGLVDHHHRVFMLRDGTKTGARRTVGGDDDIKLAKAKFFNQAVVGMQAQVWGKMGDLTLPVGDERGWYHH